MGMKWLISLIALLFASNTFAAGYEKGIVWGAKWVALGGAAVSSSQGAESLFFNPAGLSSSSKADISVNFSPTNGQFKGPITRSFEKVKGNKTWSPLFGVLGRYQISKRFGIGLGVYSVGGSKIEFLDIDFSPIRSNYRTLKPDVESDLKIIEVGLGAGYSLNKNWNIGLTWRTTFVDAKYTSATDTGAALLFVRLDGLKDTNFSSFRLGTQYTSDNKKWGVGLMYRSQVEFEAEGTSSGEFELAAVAGTNRLAGGGAVTITNVFPNQVSIGAHHRPINWATFHWEYAWSQYSRNDVLKISGTPLTLAGNNVLRDSTQHWRDQHLFKLGVDIMGRRNMHYRVGYVIGTQVTSSHHAKANSSSPGLGDSVVVGVGKHLLKHKMNLDAALEYSSARGDASSTNGIRGEYSSRAYGFHLSMGYKF